jgi:DEAD/DEAH box helicase domain-containing protein
VEHIPAREARYGDLARPLPGPLLEALGAGGISELYAHQAAAISAVRDRRHVAVTTSTASGKTLCYNLPVLESLYDDPGGRALYLFPTKALAQDQMRNLGELVRSAGLDLVWGTYDGDTPRAARGRIRKAASILLTNPDMLHLAILPNHRLWAQFLGHLRFVVVDEAHAYRGVFGSHVACVLRRLRRLCRRYGSEPVFICCSATIANPAEHVANLTGLLPVVVADDGSPRGSRDFVLWNPPLVDERKSARRSANVEASHLFAELVRHGLRNITFTKARKVAELILHYSREMLAKEDPDLVPLVSRLSSKGSFWGSRLPRRWNWEWTSELWMPQCWWAIQAPWRVPGSRRGDLGEGRGILSPSSSVWTIHWISTSCAIQSICSAVVPRMRYWTPITSTCCAGTFRAPPTRCP